MSASLSSEFEAALGELPSESEFDSLEKEAAESWIEKLDEVSV
jgi:hypothetical protein